MQDHSIQHIVVNDGSVDDTANIVRRFKAVELINIENVGAAAARNIGLQRATGDYIKFLDADDVLLANSIDLQMKDVECADLNEIAFGYWEVWRKGGAIKVHYPRDQISTQNVFDLLRNNILTGAPLFPVEALREVGGFDEKLSSRQEWNLCIRLVMAGFTFRFHDSPSFALRDVNSGHRISDRKIDFAKEEENLRAALKPVFNMEHCEVDRAVSDVYFRQSLIALRGMSISAAARFLYAAHGLDEILGRRSLYARSSWRTLSSAPSLLRALASGVWHALFSFLRKDRI